MHENPVIDLQVDGRYLELALWNTPSHEDYDRLRPLSYPESAVVVLCFAVDSLESFQSVHDHWLPEVLHFCSRPKVPLILVGCKADLRSEGVSHEHIRRATFVTPEQGREMATRIEAFEYAECSAETSYGMQYLKELIGRVATSWDPLSGRSQLGKCMIM